MGYVGRGSAGDAISDKFDHAGSLAMRPALASMSVREGAAAQPASNWMPARAGIRSSKNRLSFNRSAKKKRVMLDLSTFRSTAEERKGEDDPKAE
jgi:hypothetical protein